MTIRDELREQQADIIEALLRGDTVKEVAERFGCDRASIAHIAKEAGVGRAMPSVTLAVPAPQAYAPTLGDSVVVVVRESMTDEHTPGPWESGVREVFAFRDGERLLIAECGLDDRIDFDTAEANAELTSAAPDMLAALKQAERVLCGWDGAEDCPEEKAALAAVRAAIAKAKGAE